MKTENELEEASFHVAYEIDMVRSGVLWLDKNQGRDVFLINSILESFLVHIRNVIYFLWTDKPNNKDDILAIHFFTRTKDWQSLRPSKTELLQETYSLTHKHVAHITYSRRIDPKDREWKFVQIYRDITPAIQTFINHVPLNRLHPILREFRSTADEIGT
jgi:hypothetical protein